MISDGEYEWVTLEGTFWKSIETSAALHKKEVVIQNSAKCQE